MSHFRLGRRFHVMAPKRPPTTASLCSVHIDLAPRCSWRQWKSALRAAVLSLVWLAVVLAPDVAAADADSPASPWHEAYPLVLQDLKAGEPLVVEVLVALCSNEQIWCGSKLAGQPASLRANIYWGAIFGARTHFERKSAQWEPLGLRAVDRVYLQRAVFRRQVPAAKWGLDRVQPIEQIVVLHAIHGGHINHAVEEFYRRAARGSTVILDGDQGQRRTLRVHAVGYAGHNRLMDGIRFPPKLPPARASETPIASFVLACNSERYFAKLLRSVGSEPVVTTQTLMAPEGYVVDAVAKGLGDNESAHAIRQRAVAAYAQWQRITPNAADRIFAPR